MIRIRIIMIIIKMIALSLHPENFWIRIKFSERKKKRKKRK